MLCKQVTTIASWLLSVSATGKVYVGVKADGCLHDFMCCHTETEVADLACCFTGSELTDTRPTSVSSDPIVAGVWSLV